MEYKKKAIEIYGEQNELLFRIGFSNDPDLYNEVGTQLNKTILDLYHNGFEYVELAVVDM